MGVILCVGKRVFVCVADDRVNTKDEHANNSFICVCVSLSVCQRESVCVWQAIESV